MNLGTPFLAAALLMIGQHPQMPAGMSHEEHLEQMQKDEALKKRGADAMGFDQDAATHHFRLSPTGGSIEVSARNQRDDTTIAAIRRHLQSIAGEFSRGQFDKPFQTHAEVPPGVAEMQKHSGEIAYRYKNLPRGGAVQIETTNAQARGAVHEFLRYQITEHRTGDPLHPKR